MQEVISLPAEERRPCPYCGEMAAVIDMDTTSCMNCGGSIRQAKGEEDANAR